MAGNELTSGNLKRARMKMDRHRLKSKFLFLIRENQCSSVADIRTEEIMKRTLILGAAIAALLASGIYAFGDIARPKPSRRKLRLSSTRD